METGTVKFFDSRDNKRFGFIAVDDGGEIFFHFNDGENIEASGDEPRFCGGKLNREPKKGDVIVFGRKFGYKGHKAAPWGFEQDYRRAENKAFEENVAHDETLSLKEELDEVIDGLIGLMMGISAAGNQLSLTKEQLGIFVRNTPGKKKGEALWLEFKSRRDRLGAPEDYSFVTFMKEVLAEAGHPVN